MLIGALNNTRDAITHPEMIVPRAKRLSDFTKFPLSSLVGTSAGKAGFFKKQKYMIRIEYTEVRSVANSDNDTPNRLDKFTNPISRIKSLE